MQWFNPSAFQPPQEWAYGNSARNDIWYPGGENWDLSLMKWFYIKGEQGLRVQVRTDWFDAFNHMNLGSPSLTMGDTRDGGLAVPTFGKIYGASTAFGPVGGTGQRIIQLALRVLF